MAAGLKLLPLLLLWEEAGPFIENGPPFLLRSSSSFWFSRRGCSWKHRCGRRAKGRGGVFLWMLPRCALQKQSPELQPCLCPLGYVAWSHGTCRV